MRSSGTPPTSESYQSVSSAAVGSRSRTSPKAWEAARSVHAVVHVPESDSAGFALQNDVGVITGVLVVTHEPVAATSSGPARNAELAIVCCVREVDGPTCAVLDWQLATSGPAVVANDGPGSRINSEPKHANGHSSSGQGSLVTCR